ncbi:SH3 domain-containing protein C23A1,17 [Schizosaccharomyces pombe 972h-] [Rhizoctonia solani]|uniref:SH3 domain-containing protein C23A1,17 [Schizosaccharomyces pombe 972h-] n=1 Tax=Rhizoctonia solani TaxID=456999 RepID=A0A0K6FMP6_9AGAM|nr:SH3 domain-containing protein C23A1,17 [Schizosaccharomyces pombe 972h-] [Rhizoctonia solani]
MSPGRRRTQRVMILGASRVAGTSARLAHPDLSSLVESNFSLFLSTTSPIIDSNSSRTARSTPVLVIRPPAQPPLSEPDWEPPSALGVCSPEGFKSEQSISELRPYTPSPSVSTFASSSGTSSTVATPIADPLARPEVAQVLERATEALLLHNRPSSESLTSESVYSFTDTAPETFDPAEPEDEEPEPEKIPEIDLEPKPIEVPREQVLSDCAVESLRVERPLSPVAVGLAASSASTISRKPTIRPSLLSFFSRWADKRPPSDKDHKDKQSGPISSLQGTGVHHESSGNGSAFTRLRNKSTDKLAALLSGGEEIRPSSSSIRSSRFKIGSRRTYSGSVRTGERTDSGVVQATPQTIAQISPPASPTPDARAELPADADADPLGEGSSVRSSERGRAIESRSSTESPNKRLPARSPSEEPIGGEPVLISIRATPRPNSNPIPSSIPKKLKDKRARTGSLRDLLKKSDSTKSKKQERLTPPTPFIAWITQHTHRSPPPEQPLPALPLSVLPLPALPTPLATPHLSPPPENLSPVIETSPTDTSRILSLVWYPPELIRSPYASGISLSEYHVNGPNPTAPFDERESSISARLSNLPEPTEEPVSQPDHSHPFYLQTPPSGATNPVASISSSTVHAQPSPERKSPAKLRRKRRPGSKAYKPRTPPTSYSALARKHSRSRHESTESVAGSSIGPVSTAPSRSLDTLLNSSWPEPPIHPLKSDGEEEQAYHYLTETGAEDDSDREEYLPSPTSIGGASTRPTTPKRLRARSRSRSPGNAIRDEHPLPAGIRDDQSDWEPDSRVTSYMSASPSTARSPASPDAKAPPVPPLPQHIAPRARQRTGSTNAARSARIFDDLPLRSPSPDHQSAAVTPLPQRRSLPESPPVRSTARASSHSPTRASSTPRGSSPVPPDPIPSATPILHSPALPRRTTSYQSAASILSGRRESIDDSRSVHPTLDDGRSATTSLPKRRSPTQGRKDLHSTSRRDSGHYRRSRKDSNRSYRESIKSHRDSLTLRKDVLQAHKRDSIHSLQRRNSVDSQHTYQVTSDNQIWVVPRNPRQRPTITFEFPPTNEFWQFLNEYQQYIGPGTTRGEDNEHGPGGNDMAELRSGSATSSSSRSSRPKVDPVKDWHRVQPSSSRSSSSRASIDRTGTPYVPTPEVIERNELIIKALKNAPGALHTRFRHFGQLGVLGWSSEFSELVDEIQRCGLERQMFTTTRAQALSTCKALLKLHIDIRLQMISMFLCSQIARLRRFLDGETEYTDYPTPDFPLPEAY